MADHDSDHDGVVDNLTFTGVSAKQQAIRDAEVLAKSFAINIMYGRLNTVNAGLGGVRVAVLGIAIKAWKNFNKKIVDPKLLKRTHSIEGKKSIKNVEKLSDNLRMGQKNEPIDVINHKGDNYIIDGHHRVAASKKNGTDIEINFLNENQLPSRGFEDLNDVVNHHNNVGLDRLQNRRR